MQQITPALSLRFELAGCMFQIGKTPCSRVGRVFTFLHVLVTHSGGWELSKREQSAELYSVLAERKRAKLTGREA